MLICWLKRKLVNRRRLAWSLVAALMLAFPCHGAGDSAIRSINVARDGETYVTDAVMFAPVPVQVAWDVLTDFEHMPGWVPNLRESKVLKIENNTVTLQQSGVAKFGAASFPYVTERQLEMNKPLAIRSTQLKGSLRRVDSLMKLESEGNGTRLTYHLEIVPNLLAGTVMSKSFFEHEIPEQFGAIIGEMTRRRQ
jgi:hypothetical protein